MKELFEIQQKLKALKTETNLFAKFKYRTAENILMEIKKVAKDLECVVVCDTEIKKLGTRTTSSDFEGIQKDKYGKEVGSPCHEIKTLTEDILVIDVIATIINAQGEKVSAKAQAVFDYNHAGMSMEQRTGSAISYAKKYALGNLFAIDDNEDIDAQNNTPATPSKEIEEAIEKIANCKTMEDMRQAYLAMPENVKADRTFNENVKELKKALK